MADVLRAAEEAGARVDEPADAEVIARARRLFALQRESWPRVRELDARGRADRLRRLEAAIRSHTPAIHAAMAADLGKPYVEVEAIEIQPALREIAYAVRHLERWMRPRRVGRPFILAGSRSSIEYAPKGVVLILGAWNYPFGLAITPLVSALAAGDCAIVRPSEKTPATAAALEALVASALPEVDAAVVGGGVPAAEALLDLPFDHFFFTGGAAVGRKVMEAAARHLAGVTLELGGKCPAVVDESADLDHAAERIVRAKLANAGQTCIAPDYVLVHESRARRFLDRAVAAVARFYGETEDDRRRSPDLCRIVDERNVLRLAGVVEASVAQGAHLEVGGRGDPEARYFAPTILSSIPADSPIMQEEIFGPVLPVLTFSTREEAIAAVGSRPQPLALYVFSRNRKATRAFLDGTSSGGAVVNDAALHYFNPELPFGGIGASGIGAYHGWFGFRTFSHERAVVRERGAGLFPLLDPPYGARTRRLVKAMRWLIR